jgi:CHAT domain-containing protein
MRAGTEYVTAARRLYDVVWKPIQLHIDESSTLFVAPDAALNLVSFAGLVGANGKYLIEEHPIHYLSAARDIIWFKEPSASGQGFLALGDPDFNAPVDLRIAANADEMSGSPSQPGDYRNNRSDCGYLMDLNVEALPGTRFEIGSIARSMTQRGVDTSIYYGPAATEEHFKLEAQGKQYIHLATHGFFVQANCTPRTEEAQRIRVAEMEVIGENPLLQSGLLLAGAPTSMEAKQMNNMRKMG